MKKTFDSLYPRKNVTISYKYPIIPRNRKKNSNKFINPNHLQEIKRVDEDQ